ncbi:MAG: outer membrane lipoprotein-sorting protein [Acidobacteria bacterium]|nr:outer membrane lipoprotein-sorting protein [Acidobacteriota bacterium]
MKTTLTLVLSIMLMLAGRLGADDATQLLKRADTFRGGFDSFVTRIKITNRDAARVVEEADFEVSIKGQNSLVRFLSVRSKGQSLLMRGDDMWFFLPAVARPVRITPIQRLMGNVSNGDIARLRLADDYSPTIEGAADADGQQVTILDLRARRKGATYQRVGYFVRQSDGLPLTAEYFLTSGKPIKTARFGNLRDMGGKSTLTTIIIQDVAHPASTTTIELISLSPRELADKLFSPIRSDG